MLQTDEQKPIDTVTSGGGLVEGVGRATEGAPGIPIIHTSYNPLTQGFKDFIQMIKKNSIFGQKDIIYQKYIYNFNIKSKTFTVFINLINKLSENTAV